MLKTGCIIVTYNKINLLIECLDAVNRQSVKVDKIFIIDNASTDNTQDYIQNLKENQDNIVYCRLDKNLGGAGGFNYGLKQAYHSEVDYIWIMDDDTMPKEDALEKLLNQTSQDNNQWGFLCSNVRWINGEPCLMNIPIPDEKWTESIKNGIVKVVQASFVSILIRKEVLAEIGYPISDFFIWGDDVEFTRRISSKYSGYLVVNSEVIHKMGNNNNTDIIREEKERIARYFYDFRNRIYISRKSGAKYYIKTILSTLLVLLKIIKTNNNYKLSKVRVVLKGLISGLFFNPKIEYVNNESKAVHIFQMEDKIS
ncbi:glycosyltransferase family 2 protein [Heyndrickxia coagulans]|uniref:glycosyltransferase family 2 protein n=1 Tax=Heyndrickxia coagulans TaxID=1398 RepID=UPI002E23732E|nr:glycosyltransferase family 2 protein [Heyndrickxia coagulans]